MHRAPSLRLIDTCTFRCAKGYTARENGDGARQNRREADSSSSTLGGRALRIGFASKRQKDPHTSGGTSPNPLASEPNRADFGWVGRVIGVTWCGFRVSQTSAAVG
jgi:hypothetical protein